MAYKKEYPVLNDSGAGSLEEYTKRQEDRIEGAFKTTEIENGRNENGSWIKFPDGTMICTTSTSTDPSSSLDYRAQLDWVYPQKFIENPNVNITLTSQSGAVTDVNYAPRLINTTSSGTRIWLIRHTGTLNFKETRVSGIQLLAVGRWK